MECKKPCAKTPPVLQLVNEECPVEFHTVEIEGNAKDNPPYVGQYKNTLLVYKEDESKFLFNSDGVPTDITQVILKGITDFDELTNRPKYAGQTMTSETDIPNVLEEVAKEANAREQGDRDAIAAVSKMIDDEEAERKEVDRELQANIDKKQDALTGPQLAAVNSGIDATKVAQIGTTSTDLSNLSNSVNSLSSSLTAETANRIAADNTLQASVDTEKDAREAADTRLGGRITAEALNRSIADNTITGYIDQYFANSFSMEADASNVTLLGGLLNPVTGATMTVRETLPLATSTTAGIVTAAQHNLIEEARQELIALENGAVAITGLPASPTQAELTTAWESETGYTELMNRASIYDVTNAKVWTYYTNDTTWHMASSATSVEVAPFTNTTAGTIKGSTTAGNVTANVDGTGSVSGWTELNNTVAGKANSSDLATVATSGAYSDLSGTPTVDNALSSSSENAVQNKVIDAEFDKVAYLGDVVGTPTSLAYVGTTNIQTGAVTTDKISDLNVTTAKIADNAITANKLAPGVITADDFSDGSIPTAKLADKAVTTAKLDNLSVTTDKLAANAVSSDKIADRSIPVTKMQLPFVTWTEELSTGAYANKSFRITFGTSGRAWDNVSLIIYARTAPLQFVNVSFDGDGKINAVRRTDNSNMNNLYAMSYSSTDNTITFSAPRTYDLMKVGVFNRYPSHLTTPYIATFEVI